MKTKFAEIPDDVLDTMGQFGYTELQEEVAHECTQQGATAANNYLRSREKGYMYNPYGHASGGLKARSWQHGFDSEIEYSK